MEYDTLSPIIMEVETGTIWLVAAIGGTYFSLPSNRGEISEHYNYNYKLPFKVTQKFTSP